MELHDTVALDGVRRTADGYLVAEARVARTGVQTYRGRDVGLPDKPVVRLYRPSDEVFSDAAMKSYAFRPVTIDHPSEAVTADNWRKYAVGQTGGEVAQDGKFIRVPLVLMDAAAIRSVEGGRRELSMGYSMELRVEDGVSPDGEPYDAVQTSMKMNHLAVVTTARGGPELRIGDEGETDMADTAKTRTVLVDGLPIETTDSGAAAVEKLTRERQDARDALTAANAAHATAISAKDVTIGTLTADKKKLEDAAPKPADLDRMVADRVALVTTARVILADLKPEGLSDADIRKAVVKAKLGDDLVKDASDDMVTGMFKALAKDVKTIRQPNQLDRVIGDVRPVGDAVAKDQSAYEKSIDDLNAWRTTKAA